MKRYSKLLLSLAAASVVAACTPAAEDPQDSFFNALLEHCGNAYEGEVSAGNPEDDQFWMNNRIVIEVRECSEDRIRIPLHVGDDRSRTWVVQRHGMGLELKHDHRNEDGSHDELTWYGGATFTPGTAISQSFPADDFSKQLFSRLGYTASISNTWWLEMPNEDTLRYRLTRESRNFQVDVDLSQPVEAPPAPWGWEDDYEYNF